MPSRFAALWRLPDQIEQLRSELMSREAENFARLNATVANVKTAWASLVAERDEYKSALEGVDAQQAQAVADALANDSEHDADAIAAVEAELSSLVPNQPVEVPAEETPTNETPAEGDAPAEDVPVVPADETPADNTPNEEV